MTEMYREPGGASEDREPQVDDSATEPILDALGLELSSELVETVSGLKSALVDASPDAANVRQLWIQYSEQFEALVEQTTDPEAYTKAQIGVILHKALIFRDTGSELRYLEELDHAEIYAGNSEPDTDTPAVATLGDLSRLLAAEIEAKTAALSPGPEWFILQLKGEMADMDREALWALWADEQDKDALIDKAYEILQRTKDGNEADRIFEDLGIS